MTCSCGGQFRSAKNIWVGFSLEYLVCKSCGRAGCWQLYAPDGALLQTEEAARLEFLRLSEPTPKGGCAA